MRALLSLSTLELTDRKVLRSLLQRYSITKAGAISPGMTSIIYPICVAFVIQLSLCQENYGTYHN